MDLTVVSIGRILTRASGYLDQICSHSLQPYRGCTFGNSLCGVGCYVQHSQHLLKGRTWGGFLEVRANAAQSYLCHVDRERNWAHRRGREFSIFLSSATDPFLPQEDRFGITHGLLLALREQPPDALVIQTHTHRVADRLPVLLPLAKVCRLRVHVSLETDRDNLPDLPPHASPVSRRFEALAQLRGAGLFTVATVAPLLPIAEPPRFFETIANSADAVVLDHFIGGDGSATGSRTWSTGLPAVMQHIHPASVQLEYRDQMVEVARRFLPGRVGVGMAGFAGKYT